MAHAVQSGVLAAIAGAVGKMTFDFSSESHVAKFIHIGDASSGILERIVSVPGNFAASLIRSTSQTWLYRSLSGTTTLQSEISTSQEQVFEWSVRALLFVLMLLLNSWMLSTYVYALERSGSALRATVVNFATNFLCSVVLSLWWFGEDMEKLGKCQWLTGCGMILGGVGLVVATSQQVNKVDISSDRNEDSGRDDKVDRSSDDKVDRSSDDKIDSSRAKKADNSSPIQDRKTNNPADSKTRPRKRRSRSRAKKPLTNQ